MFLVSRMFRIVVPALLLTTVAQASPAASPSPSPSWMERRGSFILPAQDGAQLALVAFVNPATHRVTYGFRDIPQRMNCAPATLGRGQVYDVEGTRISFSKECVRGTLTYIPRNVPAKRAFAALLAERKVLHVRTQSFFPLAFDLSGLPAVQQRLELAAAAPSNRGG